MIVIELTQTACIRVMMGVSVRHERRGVGLRLKVKVSSIGMVGRCHRGLDQGWDTSMVT